MPIIAFTLGPAEFVAFALCVGVFLIFAFVYRAGKNAGRAERDRERPD